MLSSCMEHILTKDALYRLSYISDPAYMLPQQTSAALQQWVL